MLRLADILQDVRKCISWEFTLSAQREGRTWGCFGTKSSHQGQLLGQPRAGRCWGRQRKWCHDGQRGKKMEVAVKAAVRRGKIRQDYARTFSCTEKGNVRSAAWPEAFVLRLSQQ